jgi:hypothetical protein
MNPGNFLFSPTRVFGVRARTSFIIRSAKGLVFAEATEKHSEMVGDCNLRNPGGWVKLFPFVTNDMHKTTGIKSGSKIRRRIRSAHGSSLFLDFGDRPLIVY